MYLLRESLARALLIVIKDQAAVVLGKALKDKLQALVSVSEYSLNYSTSDDSDRSRHVHDRSYAIEFRTGTTLWQAEEHASCSSGPGQPAVPAQRNLKEIATVTALSLSSVLPAAADTA
jgi:hypothetical protein